MDLLMMYLLSDMVEIVNRVKLLLNLSLEKGRRYVLALKVLWML